jgi:hypothetical protein
MLQRVKVLSCDVSTGTQYNDKSTQDSLSASKNFYLRLMDLFLNASDKQYLRMSRDISHSEVNGCQMGFYTSMCWDFSLRHRLQTDSVANPATYLVSIGSSFPGGKTAGANS